MNRRRCVIVSPVVPSPTGSGLQQRAFQLLLRAALQYETTVLVAADQLETLPFLTVETLAIDVRPVFVKTGMTFGQRVAQILPLLVVFKPEWATDWPTLVVNAGIGATMESCVDLCIVFRLRMHSVAQVLLPFFAPRRMILDLDDLESATQASIGWRALFRGRLWLCLKSFSKAMQYLLLEQSVLPLYSNVSLASAHDIAVLEQRCGEVRIQHVPNRVLLPTTPRFDSANNACKTLLFVGTLSYFPNEDAVLWIVNDILPELRRRMPLPFRIVLAGRHAHERLESRLAQEKEIVFLGEVSDVCSLYAAADLALVAVRCGGGTKIKALEAAAHGCPIVGTTHAMRGLGLSDPMDYLRADTASDVAASCVFLLQQPERARNMAQSAYTRVAMEASTASPSTASDNMPF